MQTTIPLSPGMIGWPVEIDQRQIFNVLDGNQVGVRLTADNLMLPRKSLTMVIGIGSDVNGDGNTCDYCSMGQTCHYRMRSDEPTG